MKPDGRMHKHREHYSGYSYVLRHASHVDHKNYGVLPDGIVTALLRPSYAVQRRGMQAQR